MKIPVETPSPTYVAVSPEISDWVDYLEKLAALRKYHKPSYRITQSGPVWNSEVKIFYKTSTIQAVGHGLSVKEAKQESAKIASYAIKRVSRPVNVKVVCGARSDLEVLKRTMAAKDVLTEHEIDYAYGESSVYIRFNTPSTLYDEVVFRDPLFIRLARPGFCVQSADRIEGQSITTPSGEGRHTTGGLGRGLVNLPFDTVGTANTLGESYIVDGGVKWRTGDITGFNIYRAALPQIFFQNQNAPKGIAAYHAYMHCDIVITVTLPSTSFHSGWLIPYFVPVQSPKSNVLDWIPLRSGGFDAPMLTTTVRNFIHTDVYTRGNTTGELRIPYTHWQSLIQTDGLDGSNNNTFGAFGLCVWNRLRTGTGATEMSISVGMRLENAHIAVRRPVLSDPFANFSLKDAEKVENEPQSLSKPSKAVKKVAQDSDKATGWQKFTRFMGHVFSGLQTATQVVAPIAALLDRPEDMDTSARNMGMLDGPVDTQVLGTVHDQWTAGQGDLVSAKETNALYDLLMTWSRLAEIPIDVNQSAGTRLFSVSVAPHCCKVQKFGNNTEYYNTNLSFFADEFLYYRGKISYRLSISSAGEMQQGMLYATFYPDPVVLQPWADLSAEEKELEWKTAWNQGGVSYDIA